LGVENKSDLLVSMPEGLRMVEASNLVHLSEQVWDTQNAPVSPGDWKAIGQWHPESAVLIVMVEPASV
jgi:hypothetical protein